MELVWALVGVFAVLHAGYALWTAKRLDRLHQRVDVAASALDEQLRARASAALAVTAKSRAALVTAAEAALATRGLGPDREQAESALSRAIASVEGDAAVSGLSAAAARATYARAFFNDTVRDALVVRRRRIVRVFRLAGFARMPAFFEMDDVTPDRRTIAV